MRIGILGSGLMGGKLGTLFARAGHEVVFGYARSERKLKRLAREAGERARAGTPADALDEAAVEFRKAIDLNPTWIWGNIKLGMAHLGMGEHDKAMACVRRADELMGGAHGSPLSQTWLAAIELGAGDSARARNALTRLDEQSRTGYVDERGYEVRSPLMVFLFQARRFLWREAGGDARYEALMRRMGFVVS